MAFVNRGTVFTDAKDKNKVYYAELADGEVNYKSVFTGEARDHVMPELPEGAPVGEPMLAKEEQYVVAPAKDVRPVPKYSRRAQLAALATSGTSAAFNRNLANRLWAMMMGRGLVEPLDMHHSDNPPVQSELLALLADELVRTKYDLKGFLRELALSRSYRRARVSSRRPVRSRSTPPRFRRSSLPGRPRPRSSPRKCRRWTKPRPRPAPRWTRPMPSSPPRPAARDAAEKARAEAKKASDDVSAALAAAMKDAATKEDVLKSLTAARTAADAAAAKLPDDKELAAAAATIGKRTTETDQQLATARTTVTESQPQGASRRGEVGRSRQGADQGQEPR